MLHQALQRLPGEIESVEARIFLFQLGDDAQRLRIVVEAAGCRHGGVERALAGMAERRMAEIVSQRQTLGQIFIHAKRAGERAGDLRHFEAVGQPRAVMIAFVIDEDLGLVVQPAEGGRMQDAVAVARIRRAGIGRRLVDQPPTAAARLDGIGRKHGHGAAFAGFGRGTRPGLASVLD